MTPGLQAAQAVHAALQFSVAHPETMTRWHRDSNFLVVCSVANELDLTVLYNLAVAQGIVTQIVREPDLEDEVTAIALEPGDAARRLCSSLALALREKVPV